MSWLGQLSAFFTTLAQLPAAALLVAVIAVLFLFCSFGIGIGMALRDIPKYIAQIIFFILNFILILCRKDPMSIPPDNQKENFDPTKDLKIIQGGKKSEKKRKKNLVKMIKQNKRTHESVGLVQTLTALRFPYAYKISK